ncbi:DUF7282 domain-containing protein [Halobaculum gomorrense]|uniref:PGF-CTERM protein n=1 Tax=Halobaculum gomorrense TaxID=43928 RepID=A0A1M5V4P8_9EURY|nr:PGF-CTERM sorting domain-containing protein [Halobaculum gomorrense]SHH70140.1 PGF-CTERM protein [Halobaculum gomorrense]
MVAVLVTAGFAGVSTAAVPSGQIAKQEASASVTFTAQTSGGTTMVVDEVTLPEGGFVTIHDASLTEGDALGSVVGTSGYLAAGTHQNVEITLLAPVESGTFVAMPHRDTDGDRAYDFVTTGGQADGPYTADGGAVIQSANVTVSATVSMNDQPTGGEYVVVDRVELSQPGYVTIHDSSLLDSATFESIRGTSDLLSAGVHEDVRIQLDEPLQNDDTLIPMAHMETNGNGAYDFESSGGQADGPFVTEQGEAVIDQASVELASTATANITATATGGNAVTVESVFLPEGGFVTVHDGSLVSDGDAFGSVRGTSEYLAPGYHTNVRVMLDGEFNGSTATLVAMPHKDTDDDQEYDFVTSEGQDDGPYTNDNGAVTDATEAAVSATASLDTQRSDGKTVVVESVDLSEGGFVTLHDSTLFNGDALASVVGTSEYLEAGYHENVEVTLSTHVVQPETLVAMPHRDTNDNRMYDFVEQEGGADGPYTVDGSAVVDAGKVQVPAYVEFADQDSEGDSLTVDRVVLQDGGFVTVHDSTLFNGDALGSVRGTSEYLGPGSHETIAVSLDSGVEADGTFIAMPHRDTNANRMYDFVEQEGAADGPYVSSQGAIVAAANVTYTGESMATSTPMDTENDATTETAMQTESAGDGESESTETSGPGFGAVLAVLALVAAAALATRRS